MAKKLFIRGGDIDLNLNEQRQTRAAVFNLKVLKLIVSNDAQCPSQWVGGVGF